MSMQNLGKYLWWSSFLVYLNENIDLFNGLFQIFDKHSSLNDCFHEDSGNKTANTVFAVVMVCECTIIMTITQDKNMRIINFILKLNS